MATEAARVIDQLPTNFLASGLISAALPGARIIHMRRDPIDTCLSIYFQHFEAINTYTHDLDSQIVGVHRLALGLALPGFPSHPTLGSHGQQMAGAAANHRQVHRTVATLCGIH